MSRTDKDLPAYVMATWWEPMHHWHCKDREAWRSWQTGTRTRDCDLPPEPVVHGGQLWRRRGEERCIWVAVWDTQLKRLSKHKVRGHPPHWFRHHVWNGMERRRTRDAIAQVKKEYRATGDVDTVVLTEPHRHCAQWLWW